MQLEVDRSRLHIRKSTWLRLVVILTVAACLKAAVMWIVLPVAAEKGIVPAASTTRDMYIDIARNLANGQGFRVTAETAETMMRGPGYPYFLAGLIRGFGENWPTIQFANIVFGLGTAVIVFVLARMFTGNVLVSLLSAAIFAFHPAVLLLETRAGVESLFTFLLALFMLILCRALNSGGLQGFFLAGIALGLVLLTRTSPLPIVVLLFLYLLVVYWHSQPWKHAATRTGILIVGTLIILSPWMARNYNLMGTPTFSESLLGAAAFEGSYVNKMTGDGSSLGKRFNEARKARGELAASNGVRFTRAGWAQGENKGLKYWDLFYSIQDELKYNDILLTHVLDEYRDDPSLFVKYCLYNAVRFWFQGLTPKITWLGAILMVPIILLAAVGLVLGLRRGLRVIPLTLPIIAVWAVSIPILSHARYAVPLLPFLAILAGIALNETIFAQRKVRLPESAES